MYIELFFCCLLISVLKADDFEKYCSHVQKGKVGTCITVDWVEEVVQNPDIKFNYFYNEEDATCNMQIECSGMDNCYLFGNNKEAGDIIYAVDSQKPESRCVVTLQYLQYGWASALAPEYVSKGSMYECYVTALTKQSKLLDALPEDCGSSTTADMSSTISSDLTTTTTEAPVEPKTTKPQPTKVPKTTTTTTVKTTTTHLPPPTTRPVKVTTATPERNAPKSNNGTVVALATSLGVVAILLIICIIILLSIFYRYRKVRRSRMQPRQDDHLYHFRY